MMCMDENDIVRITVALPRPVAGRLDDYARRSRWSRSTAAAALIEEALGATQDREPAAQEAG